MKEKATQVTRRLLRIRFLRYVLAGGTATVVDMAVFVLLYRYLDLPEVIDLGWIAVGKETPCLLVSFSVGLVVNFNISKYFVFSESDLRTRTQFLRFAGFAFVVFVGNYLVMRSIRPIASQHLDETTLLYPVVVRAVPALAILVFSYLYHKYFSFEVQRTDG